MVSDVTLETWNLPSFAGTFLSRAKKPACRFIAPGIETFTATTFQELLASEPSSSVRQCTIRDFGMKDSDPDMHVVPTLLFPSTACVSITPGHGIDVFYEFGIFFLERRVGLYLQPGILQGDNVLFVDGKGATEAFQFPNLCCTWPPMRGTRLVEVLEKWRELIETVVWKVDRDGVMGGIEWFGKCSSEVAKGSGSQNVDVRLDWQVDLKLYWLEGRWIDAIKRERSHLIKAGIMMTVNMTGYHAYPFILEW
ncbi:hypothetical protein MMC24_001322 [Lignoscripta atroalba]|nr:hypothetical protein [Lignoscripta atroalba]